MKPKLSQDYLKSILDYEPENGVFIWKIQKGNFVKAGMIAGSKKNMNNRYSWVSIKIDWHFYHAHRLAWLYMYGEWPEDQIDHIDGDSLNNKIINLRCVSNKENSKNRATSKRSKTGLSGVVIMRNSTKYMARITVDGKLIYLGQTDDFFEACCARKSAERKYGFHINHGRERLNSQNQSPANSV